MRYKILSVDDSKTVRIIIKKAFKNYDCDILEAANGVEGLAIATKEPPDVILLDVTMPVMDGVEMLTKLKADANLKNIPVVMLTAEGGKDHVLKIAKIGVRDYIVKPFKEDLLVQKVGRIIDLKPISDAPAKGKSIFDPAKILVVEDKPAILTQIQDGLKHTPWQVHGVATTGEAIDYCNTNNVDLIMMSLSLPDDAAFTLFRVLRTSLKTKYTPIFGLVVKTDSVAQQQAQQVGFSAIATKPLDLPDLEQKMARAMNLDTSERYFRSEPDLFVMRLPEACTPAVVAEVSTYLRSKVADAVDSGINRAVFDLHEVKRLDMPLIKLLLAAMQTCREVALSHTLVGSGAIVAECKGYEDTRGWQFHETIEEARQSFQKGAAAPAAA
jgi:two-component system cell cycle response regulator